MVEVQRIITCETTYAKHEAVLRQERHDLLAGNLDSPQVIGGKMYGAGTGRGCLGRRGACWGVAAFAGGALGAFAGSAALRAVVVPVLVVEVSVVGGVVRRRVEIRCSSRLGAVPLIGGGCGGWEAASSLGFPPSWEAGVACSSGGSSGFVFFFGRSWLRRCLNPLRLLAGGA